MDQIKAILAASVAHLPHMVGRKAAAEFLGHRPEYISHLIDAGELVSVKRPGGKSRRVLIPRESLRAYLERCAR